jgi:hypothetical protein
MRYGYSTSPKLALESEACGFYSHSPFFSSSRPSLQRFAFTTAVPLSPTSTGRNCSPDHPLSVLFELFVYPGFDTSAPLLSLLVSTLYSTSVRLDEITIIVMTNRDHSCATTALLGRGRRLHRSNKSAVLLYPIQTRCLSPRCRKSVNRLRRKPPEAAMPHPSSSPRHSCSSESDE